MKLLELALLVERLRVTSSRKKMVDLVSQLLKRAGPDEAPLVVRFLLGKPLGTEKVNVGWGMVSRSLLKVTGASSRELEEAFRRTGDLGEAAALLFERHPKLQRTLCDSPLELREIEKTLKEVVGATGEGARERREKMIEGLLNRCQPSEARLLVKMLVGEMRTGFSEGLMMEAIARAFGTSDERILRASLFSGEISRLVETVAKGEAVERPIPFIPLRPMLAQPVDGIKEALEEHGGETAFEFKLDGARVQIHRVGEEVKVFSRSMLEVSGSLPEVVSQILEGVRADEAILDGEVIAISRSGRPMPFQYLLRRFRREKEVEKVAEEIPLELQLFDVLYVNGHSLVDLPYERRREKLEEICEGVKLVERLVSDDEDEVEKFMRRAIEAGHEGLVCKHLRSPYVPGVRGKHWLKIKPQQETLDLVIVGAQYGYGRRKGWLSDYFLAARDERTGKFEIVGKTFKGLTDEEIKEMTERLLSLATREERGVIWVKPEIVVEVAYNEIQESTKYPCGMALRLARIVRIRNDKKPEEADTLEKVRKIFERKKAHL